MTETKIVYHVGAEDTPYLVCIPIPPEEITLGDFTKEINKGTGYRYYFKTLLEDIIVKQELKDPEAILPCYHNRVVAWITPDVTTNGKGSGAGGLVNGSPSSDQAARSNQSNYNDDSDASSIFSDTSSVMSSEVESTSESVSVVDSDEERSRESRQRQRRRKRKKQIKPPTRCASLSSMTESSSSLHFITVTLDMEACSFLGFSIYSSGDSAMPGIYVGQIYKGGAVEADGRISSNDLIMSVNDISFENIGNGEAVKILQDIAKQPQPGPIKLVVAKTNRDSMVDLHESDFTDADTVSIASSRSTFSYTLDPTAQWIQQQQGTANYGFNFNEASYYPTSYSLYSTTGSESPANSQIGGDTIRGQQQPAGPLNVNSKMDDVVTIMSQPHSGLEIKERTWLKVTIPDAFIGQDLVKWLKENISGLHDHKDARRYASTMLKNGYINNTVNKSEKFSDQCYYVCGDGSKVKTGSVDRLQSDMQGLSVEPSQRSYNSWAGKAGSVRSQGSAGTMSSSSPRSAPRGLVTARPGPGSSGSGPPSYRTVQHGHKANAPPPPSYHSYNSGSQHSGFPPVHMPPQPAPPAPAAGPLSRTESIQSLASVYSQHSMMGRPLGSMPASVASSQASFRMAMDNSMEYYSDAV
ncbi:hypothetical protein ACHWQZ_G001767 [Mnemiopsis leidyi]